MFRAKMPDRPVLGNWGGQMKKGSRRGAALAAGATRNCCHAQDQQSRHNASGLIKRQSHILARLNAPHRAGCTCNSRDYTRFNQTRNKMDARYAQASFPSVLHRTKKAGSSKIDNPAPFYPFAPLERADLPRIVRGAQCIPDYNNAQHNHDQKDCHGERR